MKLETSFDYTNVLFNQTNNINLMLSAQAPKIELAARPPINIVASVDVSYSMEARDQGGRDTRLDYVKKSLLKLIDHMSPVDRLGVVIFHDTVEKVSDPVLMTFENKNVLRAEIKKLHVKGSTAFCQGMTEGLKMAAKIDGPCTLIMLTDGQANIGVHQPAGILAAAKKQRKDHIRISSYGYGAAHNSDLLDNLSTECKGNYCYIQSPDHCLTAFAQELGGLLSVAAQNVRFKITPKKDVEIVEVKSDADVAEKDGSVIVSIPDIYSEDVKNVVVELGLKAQSAQPRPVTVADVVMKYDTPEGDEVVLEQKVKVQFVSAGKEDQKPDQKVADVLAFLGLQKAQEEAERKANRGDFEGARITISSFMDHEKERGIASMDFMEMSESVTNNAAAFYTATGYDQHTAKAFSSDLKKGRLRTRSAMTKGMTGPQGTTGGQGVAGLSSTNATQDAMVNAFAGGEINVEPDGKVEITSDNKVTVTTTPLVETGEITNAVAADEAKKKSVAKRSRRRSTEW